jgi:hypothetical protein
MAQVYSNETTGIDSQPVVKPGASSGYGARLKRFRATYTLAAQPAGAGNELIVCDLPAGYLFAFALVCPGVSLGSSTIALGNASNAAAYAAAATYTATTPTLTGSAAAEGAPALAASTRILGTIAAAALPASGTLVIDVYASLPN